MRARDRENAEDAERATPSDTSVAPSAEVGAAAAARIGPQRGAALARAVAGATTLGNRAVARLLARGEGYGYEFADDPLSAGGFGPNDATIRVRPGAIRSTLIGPRPGAEPAKTEEPAKADPQPAEPAAETPTTAPAVGGTTFRKEILALAALIDATGLKEKPLVVDPATKKATSGGIWARYGKRLVTWAGADQILADRNLMGAGYTTCGTVLNNIWNMAAAEAKKKGEKVTLSPRSFDMHKDPKSWVEASPNMPSSKRPKPGDAYYLQFPEIKNGVRDQSHVCTLKSITVVDNDKETWVSADGGQREGPGTADGVKEATRTYIPSKNLIYGGVASQAGDGRWLFGWTDVDKRVS